jgi:putative transposase
VGKTTPPAYHHQTPARPLGSQRSGEVEQCWSMDFVADNPFNGRRIRALTVVDNFSWECLAIQVGQGLRGEDVVAVLYIQVGTN